jgi:hypothetical protein
VSSVASRRDVTGSNGVEMLRDFDAALGIVGRNIRDALLSSSTQPKLRRGCRSYFERGRPTVIAPHIKVIRRGKGPRKQYSVHHRARAAWQ